MVKGILPWQWPRATSKRLVINKWKGRPIGPRRKLNWLGQPGPLRRQIRKFDNTRGQRYGRRPQRIDWQRQRTYPNFHEDDFGDQLINERAPRHLWRFRGWARHGAMRRKISRKRRLRRFNQAAVLQQLMPPTWNFGGGAATAVASFL